MSISCEVISIKLRAFNLKTTQFFNQAKEAAEKDTSSNSTDVYVREQGGGSTKHRLDA